MRIAAVVFCALISLFGGIGTIWVSFTDSLPSMLVLGIAETVTAGVLLYEFGNLFRDVGDEDAS